MTATSAGSRPTSSQCRRSTSVFASTRSTGTLQPSASRAAMRRVRRSPPPPTISEHVVHRSRVAGGLGQRRPVLRRTPWCRGPTAPASSRSRSRAGRAARRGGGNGRPNAEVLALPPAGADAAERASAGDRVEGGDGLGGDPGRPERHRRDQGAEPEVGVEAGEQAERDPGLRDRLPGGADLRDLDEVVHQRDARRSRPGAAAGAMSTSQPSRVLAPREPRDAGGRRRGRSGAPAPPRAAARPPAGGSSVDVTRTTWSQPSSGSRSVTWANVFSWSASTRAGTGRSRPALRRRHSAAGCRSRPRRR